MSKENKTSDKQEKGNDFIADVVGRSEQLECDVCYQPTNNIKDDEGYRYCKSCEKL